MAERLGIATTLHKLRHYNATELLAAGVDLRTVAGRLGHGGGGTTTLKVYAAWVSEADKRAAGAISGRLPAPGRRTGYEAVPPTSGRRDAAGARGKPDASQPAPGRSSSRPLSAWHAGRSRSARPITSAL
jgi:integrase-like protein